MGSGPVPLSGTQRPFSSCAPPHGLPSSHFYSLRWFSISGPRFGKPWFATRRSQNPTKEVMLDNSQLRVVASVPGSARRPAVPSPQDRASRSAADEGTQPISRAKRKRISRPRRRLRGSIRPQHAQANIRSGPVRAIWRGFLLPQARPPGQRAPGAEIGNSRARPGSPQFRNAIIERRRLRVISRYR